MTTKLKDTAELKIEMDAYGEERRLIVRLENRVAAERNALLDLLRQMPTAVFLIDKQEQPVFANEAFYQMFPEVDDTHDATLADWPRVYVPVFLGTKKLYPVDKFPVLVALRENRHVLSTDMELVCEQERMRVRIKASPIHGNGHPEYCAAWIYRMRPYKRG